MAIAASNTSYSESSLSDDQWLASTSHASQVQDQNQLVQRFASGAAALLLWAVLTSGVTYSDPLTEQQRAGSSSVLSASAGVRTQAMTIHQAKNLALQVLRDAKEELGVERAREFKFISEPWS